MKFNFLNFLNDEKNKPYFQKILKVINNKDKHIFPTQELLFNAFENFDYDNLKIVLLGQDPYHTKNVADGLAFSTQKNNLKTPASLKNIFKEIRNCYPDSKFLSNNLNSWKNQGILLVNTILTVEEGKPLSHKNIGWERFVSELLNTLNNTYENIIYLCFGVKAFNFASSLANIQKHIILKTSHPSPFSYKKGFENSKIFLKVNDKLHLLNKKKIDWNTY